MKKLILTAIAAVAAAASLGVHAANDNKTFDVTVSVTPKCQLTAPSNITLAYTSFQTSSAVSTSSDGGAFTVKCTTGLAYSLGFDTTPTASKSVSASAANKQLGYTLDIVDGSDAVASSGTGTGTTAINRRVRVTIGANLSGDCTGSCTGTAETNTVYVVY